MPPLRVCCLVVLASFGQASETVGQDFLLPPPRNLTLVSKDFHLFLTWLPVAGDLPGVSYTVQWMEPYTLQWKDISHCRDISETVCNITCVSPELDNRYSVQVKAQRRNSTGMASSKWVEWNIDYAAEVEPAPPILQLKKTENGLEVSTAFSYPSCAKTILQHLIYDLEFVTDGAGQPRKYSGKKENVLAINTTQWGSGRYCVRARAFFPMNEKWSNFSKPVCTLLHKKAENWIFVVLPLLLLFPAGAFTVFCCYKNMTKQIKMPQALDFSKGPEKLLLIRERELMKWDPLTCVGAPVKSGRRDKTGPEIHSALSPSVHSLSEESEDEDDDSEDDDDDDDDSGSPIPYTKVLQFQNKSLNCPMASLCLEAPLPSSNSASSQSGLMVPEVPAPTEGVTGEAASGFQETEGTSSSESSSVEGSLGFPVGFPSAGGRGWDEDIDFSSVLIGGPDINLLTGKQFMAFRGHPEENCASLWGLLGNRDSCELHFEEQPVDERGSENDSSGCGSLLDEMPLLKVPCQGLLENGLLGENRDLELGRTPKPKFHGYRLRHTHYIART